MRGQLFLNDTLVDLKDEIQASLTYQISDIRKPQNRNGSYSKTVTLPGTKAINKLLSGIFEIGYITETTGTTNFVPDFNPNLKCTAVYYVDGLEQFRGFMKLLDIKRSQQDIGNIEYEVWLTGEETSIFGALGETKLSDLDWSDLNHTYNKATQQATWTNTNYGSGYVYPMINYGGIPAGTWDVNNFFPATYKRDILLRIFNHAGYQWDSTFLDSDYFKHLVIPYSGDKLSISASQATNRLFSATTGSITSGVSSLTIDPVIFNTESLDPSNQYNTATGLFTVANSGYYEFYVSGTSTMDAITTVVTSGAAGWTQAQIVVTRGATTYFYPVGSSQIMSIGNATFTSGQIIATQTWGGWCQQLLLLTGDTVHVSISIYISNTGGSGTVGSYISAGARYMNRITNTQVVDGSSLDYSAVIPTDVRCQDYLSDTIKLYNLYVENDETIPTKLKIDTYESFYGTGSTRNWDDKLDVSQPVDIQPMGALNAHRYVLKWADDSDYWNRYYLGKFGETFGMKNYDIDNDFLKNTEKLEVMFAGTPCIGSNSHDRIIPEIYQQSNSGVQTPIKSKLRILYWGGALATTNSWTYTSYISGSSTETTYPYAGHVDNPITPTYDVNIGVPREVYYVNPYGTTQYTDDNIFNRYHRQYYDEITNPNSKILVAFFYLKPLDIYNLSFRDKIFLLGHYWRINKVIDYNPTREGVTKVELLKLKAGVSYTRTLKDLTFTKGETISRDNAPGSGGNVSQGDLGNASMNSYSGTNIYIDSTSRGVTASGSDLRVGANCRYVDIVASSGVTILDGLSNVSVTNSNDLIVSESNTTYMNSRRIDGESNWKSITTSQTVTIPGKYYVSGTITITLDSTANNEGETFTFKKTDAGTTTTINGGGVNIDGATTTTLTSQWESKTIDYDAGSTKYYIT